MKFSGKHVAFVFSSLLCLRKQCCGQDVNLTEFMNTIQSINTNQSDNLISNSDINIDAPEQIQKYGYPAETHTIQTNDGYILSVHRIPHGRSSSDVRVRAPVLVMHGLLASSDAWVVTGPQSGLGFILADAGYDVWLGNARGNCYSRKHATMSPRNSSFWNFSWHEMGNNDLPAVIDYILEKTNQQQLFYIGHSMGTTMFFSLMSTQPEYNKKIRLMTALAPAVFIKRQRNLAGELLYFGKTLADGFHRAGQVDLFPRIRSTAKIGEILCRDGQKFQAMCAGIYYLSFGNEVNKQLNKTLLPSFIAHFPAGTSLYTADHFFQIFKSGTFQWYDKSRRYKAMPKYDLGQVSAPVALYYGKNDGLIHPDGVIRLGNLLPNVVRILEVTKNKFNHMDFVVAIDVKEQVFDEVLNLMMKY